MNGMQFGNILLLGCVVISIVNAVRQNNENVRCPAECICEIAPLRTAPFVLNWMTSWGEDSIPEVHQNDILNPTMMVSSGTAKDANVNVNKIGLHVTCSLHSTTNTKNLLSSIPPKTMVLTLLQAPGCNFTVIDGGQLTKLIALTGLHIQGYAHEDKIQVSGYSSNKVTEVVSQQKILTDEIYTNSGNIRELTLALAEDALKSLIDLRLLDLQYVKLVASKVIRRLRRYSMNPISSKTLLNLPLPNFIEFAKDIEDFQFPPYFEDYEGFYSYNYDDSAFPTHSNLKLKLYRKNNINEQLISEDSKKYVTPSNYFNIKDVSSIFPYMTFRANFQQKLSPFTNQKRLKYLRIANGKLEQIGPGLFEGIHKLHTLTLEHNFIQVIPEDTFTSLTALTHLSLAHNKILSGEFKSLYGLSRLLTLDLDFNEIQSIGTTSFPTLRSLKVIRALGNPITQIFPDAFISVNNTENIYIGSTSNAMEIHEDSFRSLPFLNTLVLQNVTNSNLKNNLFNGIPDIKYLTMHGQITEIDFDAFSKISLLKELDLSFCNIEKLSMDAFYGLHNLKLLDLSHNKLTEIAPGTFDYLFRLKELYMNHNQLTTLPLGIFLPIPAKLIRLEKNPWDCTCNLLPLRPSITNKVKRLGSVVCRWSDKLATVCRKTRDRLYYDARVAPLCVTPPNLSGNDVYHAALRHLKCSKYHWDPSLLFKEKSTRKLLKPIQVKSSLMKETKKTNDTYKQMGRWTPLLEYTPVPIPKKDLFDIVEMEDLEEVEEIIRNNSEKTMKIHPAQGSSQNDEPESVNNPYYTVFSKDYIKRLKLMKIAPMKQKEVMKRDYSHILYQKAKLKKYIKNRKKEAYQKGNSY